MNKYSFKKAGKEEGKHEGTWIVERIDVKRAVSAHDDGVGLDEVIVAEGQPRHLDLSLSGDVRHLSAVPHSLHQYRGNGASGEGVGLCVQRDATDDRRHPHCVGVALLQVSQSH